MPHKHGICESIFKTKTSLRIRKNIQPHNREKNTSQIALIYSQISIKEKKVDDFLSQIENLSVTLQKQTKICYSIKTSYNILKQRYVSTILNTHNIIYRNVLREYKTKIWRII
jgi:hypothetical protein